MISGYLDYLQYKGQPPIYIVNVRDGPRITSKSGLPEMWAQSYQHVRLTSDFGRISQQILGLKIVHEFGGSGFL
jgi:hypothetical protein